MSKLIKIMASALVLAAVLAPHASFSQNSILSLPNKTIVLKNGLKVVMVKYPSPGVISVQMPVRVGSRNEVEAGKTGFAHFFEHLMFRGTKNRSNKQLRDTYVRLGTSDNAWTAQDLTNYHAVVARQYLPELLDLEADRFMNLYFDEKALRDEAGAVLGEYNKNAADPDYKLDEKLWDTAYVTHTYKHEVIGYEADIRQYPERYKDVWPFFKRYYRPGNVTLILVGDVDFAKDQKLVESKFGKWKDPDFQPVTIPVEPEQKEPRFGEVMMDKDVQGRAYIGYKIPSFTTQDLDAASLRLLAEIYFSKFSEFQKEYVFKRRLLDSVEATPYQMKDPGLWGIYLRFTEEGQKKEKDVLKAVDQVIAQVRDKAPTQQRLVETRTRFKNQALTGWFQSPESLAGVIARYMGYENDIGVLDRVFQRYQEVKPENISGFAKKYLLDSRKTTVVLHGSKK